MIREQQCNTLLQSWDLHRYFRTKEENTAAKQGRRLRSLRLFYLSPKLPVYMECIKVLTRMGCNSVGLCLRLCTTMFHPRAEKQNKPGSGGARTPLIPALGRQRYSDFWVPGQPGLQSELYDKPGLQRNPVSKKPKYQKKKKKPNNNNNQKQQQKTKRKEGRKEGRKDRRTNEQNKAIPHSNVNRGPLERQWWLIAATLTLWGRMHAVRSRPA